MYDVDGSHVTWPQTSVLEEDQWSEVHCDPLQHGLPSNGEMSASLLESQLRMPSWYHLLSMCFVCIWSHAGCPWLAYIGITDLMFVCLVHLSEEGEILSLKPWASAPVASLREEWRLWAGYWMRNLKIQMPKISEMSDRLKWMFSVCLIKSYGFTQPLYVFFFKS